MRRSTLREGAVAEDVSPSPSPILSLSQLSMSPCPQTPRLLSQTFQSILLEDGATSLLSSPEFHEFSKITTEIKVEREVHPSATFQPYTTRDFLPTRSKYRPSRGKRKRLKGPNNGNANVDTWDTVSSRAAKARRARLADYKPILERMASKKEEWKNWDILPEIQELWSRDEELFSPEPSGLKAILTGIIVKKDTVKPGRILRLCTEILVIPIPLKPVEEPCLYLEDRTGRVRLSLKWHPEGLEFYKMVSGVPAALLGKYCNGVFSVQEVLFATPPSPRWSCFGDNRIEMVFVSSLHVGGNACKPAYLDLLLDYLQGLAGSPAEQEDMLAPKTRVFFVGNLFCKRERWSREEGERLVDEECKIAQQLDTMFENLSRTMEVYIVPGDNDPSYLSTLPQPPIHKQLFPDASERQTFLSLSNPAQINVSMSTPTDSQEREMFIDMDKKFLSLVLTSGKNVKETMEFCDIECPLEMASRLLEWSHLLPTSVSDSEISAEILSIKRTLPHLFVVGGLAEFKVREWNGVKIVGLPSFAKTATAVVFTKGCDIVPLNFKICV